MRETAPSERKDMQGIKIKPVLMQSIGNEIGEVEAGVRVRRGADLGESRDGMIRTRRSRRSSSQGGGGEEGAGRV